MDNRLKTVVPPYSRVFIETLLRYYPEGTEEERALKAAEMYGKRAEMEVVLQQRKKERGLFGVFRSSGKSLIEVLEEVCRPESILEQGLTLDEQAADKGLKQKPNDWIKYWNKVKDGRVMASMGDLYSSFKIIKKMHEGTEQEKAKAQLYLNSLREDFVGQGQENGLIANTKLFYSSTSVDARIVQHYQCRKPELTTEKIIEVPVYQATLMEKVVQSEPGLTYLHTLLDTEDDAETIIKTFEFISGKRGSDMGVWTALTDGRSKYYTRKEKPERVAGFVISVGQFRVGGSFDGGPGCSRGVRL